MRKIVRELVELLDLETIEVDHFRGPSSGGGWRHVFGGHVLGQALVAASRTVSGRMVHSLHAYFLRPGDPEHPILYEVDRIRDGKSFTTRRVVAIQHGRAIFNMSASFQVEESGFEHQAAMPDVPGPEELEPEIELRRREAHRVPEAWRHLFVRERPVQVRPVEPLSFFDTGKRPPYSHVWLRAADRLPDDPVLHRAVLAYASDLTLLDTSILPHPVAFPDPRLQTASLDHAMWFHRPFRADEWLLYAMDSPSASGARGLSRGSLYRQDGTLVASCAQEGLIRLHREPRETAAEGG